MNLQVSALPLFNVNVISQQNKNNTANDFIAEN